MPGTFAAVLGHDEVWEEMEAERMGFFDEDEANARDEALATRLEDMW